MSNAYSLKYKWTVEVCGKMSHDMPTRRIIVFYSAHVEANGASSWKLGNIGVEWISHTMTARCPRKPMPKQKADPKICKSALKILLYFACGNFSISEINFRSLKSDGYLKFQKSCFHFLESNYRQDFFKMSLRVINLEDLLIFKETWWLWSSTTAETDQWVSLLKRSFEMKTSLADGKAKRFPLDGFLGLDIKAKPHCC